jgi:hypothetical protein
LPTNSPEFIEAISHDTQEFIRSPEPVASKAVLIRDAIWRRLPEDDEAVVRWLVTIREKLQKLSAKARTHFGAARPLLSSRTVR